MCSGSLVVLVLAVMTRFVCSAAQGKLLWGFTCNAITIAYYGAPLSSALVVVRSKDSSCIYLPTCIANLVNASLWVAYGIAVKDPFIWVPNGVGGVFAVLLILLCVIFPRKAATAATGQQGLLPKSQGRNSKEHLLLGSQAGTQEGCIRAYCPADASPATSGHGQVEVVTSASTLKATSSELQQRRGSNTTPEL
ncbi:hypothetical protein OEZ86_003464 [Tetradesmus obliquus]|nr:hypothetical protein OEZ86_003464 [Tetradesmus obliquus]